VNLTENLGRCPRCRKFMVAEEWSNHECDFDDYEIRGCKEIVLDHITDSGLDKNGDRVHLAWALDGMLYRLLVCSHNPPHSAKRKFTPDRDDDTNHRLDNTVRCGKAMIEEEQYTHTCSVKVEAVQEILVDHCYTIGKDENDDTLFFALGLDGVLYRLVVCKHRPPHRTTKRNFTSEGDDDTHQGLYRAIKLSVYRGMPYVISTSIT
jgi:hypothetical protein